MKNLFITLTLVLSLIVASTAAAEVSQNTDKKDVETLMVVSTPEVANFEIYSLELADAAMKQMMEAVNQSLSTPISSVSNNLKEIASSLTSSI